MSVTDNIPGEGSKDSYYVSQFWKYVAGIFAITTAVVVVFIVITIKKWIPFADAEGPLKNLLIDGSTLANYVSLVFSTSVALAGSWVAIRIAQGASIAQIHANELQVIANKLSDPKTQRAHQVLVARNRLLSAYLLLKSARGMTTAASSSIGEAELSHFLSTARQLRSVITDSLLNPDMISCCITSRAEGKFLGAVNEVMNRLHYWDTNILLYGAEMSKVELFIEHQAEFFSRFEDDIKPAIDTLQNWEEISDQLN